MQYTPVSVEIAQDIVERIPSGSYPVGKIFPTEMQRCKQYGTSRHSGREALRKRQETGFIVRCKKLGARVEAISPKGEYIQSLAPLKQLTDFGAKYERKIKQAKETVIHRIH